MSIKHAIVFIAAILSLAASGPSQDKTPQSCLQPQDKTPDSFDNKANRWMRVPVDLKEQQELATATERQARDKYWDRLIGATAPLWSSLSAPRALPMVDFAPTTEEFTQQELHDGVWLIGTFEGYSTHLSASELSIYTEIHFRVSRIVGSPEVPNLNVGSLISIGRGGGTILAPWGKVVSYRVSPQEHDFQPNHTYLVMLYHLRDLGFYVFSERIGRRWDLADGTAKPDTISEIGRSERKKSSVAGLPVEDAADVLATKIREAAAK